MNVLEERRRGRYLNNELGLKCRRWFRAALKESVKYVDISHTVVTNKRSIAVGCGGITSCASDEAEAADLDSFSLRSDFSYSLLVETCTGST